MESVLITTYGYTEGLLFHCLEDMIKTALLFATKINSGKPDITSQVCVFDKYVSGFLETATEHFNKIDITDISDRVNDALQAKNSSNQNELTIFPCDKYIIKNNREKLFFVIWHLYNSVAISVIILLVPDLITMTANKNNQWSYDTKDILGKAKEVMEGFNKVFPSSTYSTTGTKNALAAIYSEDTKINMERYAAILRAEVILQGVITNARIGIKYVNDGMEVRKIKNNVLGLLKSALKKVSTTKKDFCGQQQDPTQCRFLKLLDTCSLSHGKVVFPEQG
ncbi:hypothetical protein H4219_006261 [Mycoemilia scoparia]|uniref:Uncharacterized protein n=1 Tax=Mycoemilia scoparia TaxID=417184 RepID=A0A9W8DMB6_9FUNG|nr:hypothetical protein H4219_006261 [Mycoemilia scoparia]